MSAYGRLKIHHLYVAGTMTDCPLKRGVCLWEVKNSTFVCGWDDDRLSIKRGVWLWEVKNTVIVFGLGCWKRCLVMGG